MTRINCKNCKKKIDQLIYDFGKMPAVNSFFTKEMIKYEKPFPLKLYICNYCWLIQLSRMPNKNLYLMSIISYQGRLKETRSFKKIIEYYLQTIS